MKIQRNIVYCSLLLLLITFYLMTKSDNANVINILIGIIASSIVLLISALVSYMNERKKSIDAIIVGLNDLRDELGTLRTSAESVDVLYNISLIEKCHMRLLRKIRRDCSELTFLFRNKIKMYISKSILDPIDMMFFDISLHYGMLRWILLYKENDEDLICAHYLQSVRIESRKSKKETRYIPIERYIGMSSEERIKYHNNEIISMLIYPDKADNIKGDTVVHALGFIVEKITLLYSLPYKAFISDKQIKKMLESGNKTSRLWDDVSNESHSALKNEIIELKSKQTK